MKLIQKNEFMRKKLNTEFGVPIEPIISLNMFQK